jgi:hypothetical protein
MKSKWVKIPFYFFLFVFAGIGLFLTLSYAAIQFGWTKDAGIVDANNRYFQEMQNKYDQDFHIDSAFLNQKHYEALERITLLNEYYPQNASYILTALQAGTNELEVLKMLDAVDMQLKDQAEYQRQVKQLQKQRMTKRVTALSAFDWMNIDEWKTFKEAVVKDRKLIDSVSRQTGVESRLIVSCLVGEQIRLFNSSREAYKKWIGPLKILSVESKFSLGVTGIKELTAMNIEKNLKDTSSIYYLGKQYEKLLDFKEQEDTAIINKERVDRLIDFRNHFYSYMYAALFLKQVKVQWERAGFPIHNRPEILATLFNVGFPQSKPKSNPRVGGSTIQIYEKPYSFGAIAFQFYYSGELHNIFPYRTQKFDWNEKS